VNILIITYFIIILISEALFPDDYFLEYHVLILAVKVEDYNTGR